MCTHVLCVHMCCVCTGYFISMSCEVACTFIYIIPIYIRTTMYNVIYIHKNTYTYKPGHLISPGSAAIVSVWVCVDPVY